MAALDYKEDSIPNFGTWAGFAAVVRSLVKCRGLRGYPFTNARRPAVPSGPIHTTGRLSHTIYTPWEYPGGDHEEFYVLEGVKVFVIMKHAVALARTQSHKEGQNGRHTPR